MYTIRYLLACWFISLFLVPSCTFDELPEPEPPSECEVLMPTYENEIKPIIDTYCAYPGCHVSGFPNGNYETYESMLFSLENGQIRERAIIQMDMPDFTAPADLQELPAEDLKLLECWLANGFPKN